MIHHRVGTYRLYTLKVQWERFSSGRLSANDDEVDRKPHFTLLLFVNCLDLDLAIKVRILTVRICLFLASCSKLTQKYMNNSNLNSGSALSAAAL